MFTSVVMFCFTCLLTYSVQASMGVKRSSAWHSFKRCTPGKGLLGFLSNRAPPMLISCFVTYTNFLNSSRNMVANQIKGNRDNNFLSFTLTDKMWFTFDFALTVFLQEYIWRKYRAFILSPMSPLTIKVTVMLVKILAHYTFQVFFTKC